MNKTTLKLKGNNYETLINKFKEREQQTSIQEALVYLKLRQYDCNHRRSLIFSKKQQKCIDGTLHKDGPAGFKKLDVLKPDARLTNGWLRGEKHKYIGTTGYTDFLKKHESAQKQSITSYNQKSRQLEENQRKARSKSTVFININDPQRTIEKIGSIKEEASRQRQNRNLYVQYSNVRLDQTTKNFFKETQCMQEDGLIVKLGAFEHIITDKKLNLKQDATNLKGKTLTVNEIDGSKKRVDIMQYQQNIKNFTDSNFNTVARDQNSWKKLIHIKPNKQKQLIFDKKTLEEASNPLILSHTKMIKRDLSQNQKKCRQNITDYTNFYQDIQKAIKMDFLSKRKYSHPLLSRKNNNKMPNAEQEY